MIAATMGDSSGVGPEIAIKAFINNELGDDCILIGDMGALELCMEKLGWETHINEIQDISQAVKGSLNVLDMKLLKKDDICPGTITQKSGYAAAEYVKKAVELALNGQIDAIVTLPMNKEATRLSISDFSGHTELIAGMCGQENYTMMLYSKSLIVTHVSTHVSMLDAIGNVKKDRVYNVIKLTYNALTSFVANPKIAVAGLNAHAGEHGSFGDEEIKEIVPAIEMAQKEGIDSVGPEPPDTVFLKAYHKKYDAVVCMYHDQGHIPMKLLNFDEGVNVTLGLKVIRTSVDHGTAFDIAYKGLAKTDSFVEALKMAKIMSKKMANYYKIP
jgi:4-hydroxythreonine-4-phosphate dehydrogenase